MILAVLAVLANLVKVKAMFVTSPIIVRTRSKLKLIENQ